MKAFFSVIISLCLFAFISDEPLFIQPENFPPPTYDFTKNPLSKHAILLGRALFYDPILSHNNTISCESCHSPFSAFTHVDHALSHGIYDSVGKRNSPALMNLAWQSAFMWDGAVNHLDVLALAPISHPSEMASSIQNLISKLNTSNKYKRLFFAAFQDSTANSEKTLKAISQFLLTLVSANSKYDKVMRHETEFTGQETRGYLLYKRHCASCHAEPLFTNHQFENNGLASDPQVKDYGRIGITGRSGDSLKFKVPTLRNIEYTYPYMHDGRYTKLSEVLSHYTNGIQTSATLSNQLRKGIKLTSDDKVDIISFLLTLTDKEFVFNPKHQFPK